MEFIAIVLWALEKFGVVLPGEDEEFTEEGGEREAVVGVGVGVFVEW